MNLVSRCIKGAIFFLFLDIGNVYSQPELADSIIKKSSLMETLFFLSHDTLKGRLSGSKGANIAAAFLAKKFLSIGLNPVAGNEGYYNYFLFSKKNILSKNVMGALPGQITNDTIVIFSAHYDHIGAGETQLARLGVSDTDSIYNGANDNASGIASLLELAKYYKAQNTNRYLLLFVAFSGEEQGMVGSEYLASKIKPGIIKAVVNLEMLGRPTSSNVSIISKSNIDITIALNRYLGKYQAHVSKPFFVRDHYPNENLFARSDHYPFALRIKTSFTIMGSAPDDKYYHTTDDEYETINFDFLLTASKNIAMACEYFIK